ncbi:MAG: hypothetical protein H7248_05620 [Microbacteriaceae bacterium]|nr:hypothetical protein [Microbacteriaceae bacterium]
MAFRFHGRHTGRNRGGPTSGRRRPNSVNLTASYPEIAALVTTVGSLLPAIPGGNGLRNVGRVGTGFTDRELDTITVRLAPLERATAPARDVPDPDACDARWVQPKLIAEVEFAQWAIAGRLRQSSWRGFRPDKNLADITPESGVRRKSLPSEK